MELRPCVRVTRASYHRIGYAPGFRNPLFRRDSSSVDPGCRRRLLDSHRHPGRRALYNRRREAGQRDHPSFRAGARGFFLRASPVRSLGDFPLRIFQFDTESQYKPFRPNEFTIAYFVATPAREFIVMGDRASKDYTSSIHEYMHLIVRHSGLKLPTWLNEGWADVFSTLRPMGKDTAVGDLLPDRMRIPSIPISGWTSTPSLRLTVTLTYLSRSVARRNFLRGKLGSRPHALSRSRI